MTQTIESSIDREQRRAQWLGRVESAVGSIELWAQAQGWATTRSQRTVNELALGEYAVPLLRVRLPEGELHVIPVALQIVGGDGRIDIEAFPTLNRVKLIGRGGEWVVYTDSNVPLRQPWNAETFAVIARDLVA